MGSGTKVHVLFAMRESYFSCIAHSHSLEFSHVNASSIFWHFSKNATVACSTSLLAIHQSQNHSFRCFWSLSLGTCCEGSLDGLSFETTIFFSNDQLGVDSFFTPSIVVSFNNVSQLKVNGSFPSTPLFTISCTITFFTFLGWSTPPNFFDLAMDTTFLLLTIILISTHIKQYAFVLS